MFQNNNELSKHGFSISIDKTSLLYDCLFLNINKIDGNGKIKNLIEIEHKYIFKIKKIPINGYVVLMLHEKSFFFFFFYTQNLNCFPCSWKKVMSWENLKRLMGEI